MQELHNDKTVIEIEENANQLQSSNKFSNKKPHERVLELQLEGEGGTFRSAVQACIL